MNIPTVSRMREMLNFKKAHLDRKEAMHAARKQIDTQISLLAESLKDHQIVVDSTLEELIVEVESIQPFKPAFEMIEQVEGYKVDLEKTQKKMHARIQTAKEVLTERRRGNEVLMRQFNELQKALKEQKLHRYDYMYDGKNKLKKHDNTRF